MTEQPPADRLDTHGYAIPAEPGWHPDPEAPGQERYWSGTTWGADTRVARYRPSPPLLAFGYGGAVLVPIVGLVIGIILLVRRSFPHGVAIVLLSLAFGALYVAISV